MVRAHGVPKRIIEELEENNIKYLDRTCKEVKKIHDIVTQNLNLILSTGGQSVSQELVEFKLGSLDKAVVYVGT